jgi:exonuclease SbcD
VKLLCCGDFHIGAGVGTYGPERLADFGHVLEQIHEIAVRERVDSLLFAGDAFERRIPSPAELMVFKDWAESLPCDAMGIPGNHDVSSVEGPSALDLFDGDLHIFSKPLVRHMVGYSVACLPWTPLSRLVATQGRHEGLQEHAAELLLDTARGLREQIDGPAVLLGHWSVSGAGLPNGMPTDQLTEVVLPVSELQAMNWDAVVLGHIHRRQEVRWADPAGLRGPIFYVGSPMPLNFGESQHDQEHGVWIVEPRQNDVTLGTARFVPLDSRRFVTVDVDLTVLDNGADVTGVLVGHAGTHEFTDAIVKVRYACTEEQARRLDGGRVRQVLLDGGAWRVTLQPEVVRTTRARAEGIDETLGPLESLHMWTEAEGIEQPERDRLGALTARLLRAVES